MKELSLKHLLLLLLLFVFSGLHAQYQDFRSWWVLGISKDISKNTDAKLDLSQRFDENSLHYDRTLATLSLEHEIFDYLDAEGGFRYILLNDDKIQGFESKFRVHANVTYKYDLDAFTFSVREQFQYGFDDISSVESYYTNKFSSRSRVNLKYDIFASPLSVYSSYELFIDLNSPYGISHSANRLKAGLEINLPGRYELDLSYMFEGEKNVINPRLSHVLVISFTCQLR